ncbi:WYL domain-containing protein [Paenibacillus albidus]|uniref:helix-turn-helix transcriptional regulator n=1 Tax=Paenibacillus albidus TaxID=2041023 RepID=UPI001BE78ADC|nr:WYL domain-containing protein [Paenibacillus albidus]MBT2287875.1 WYL domain-containing protein [Paenibacillus albidus]
MRVHRLIAILLLIESRGKIKAGELASALETSVRSVYRDIDVLCEAGIPLVTKPGPNGGIFLMDGYTVNLKQLHGEDVINLYLTGMGIYSGGRTESGLKLRNTLLKLEKTLPPAYRQDVETAKNRFYFDDTPWWSERAEIPCLETVRSAVWRSEKLEIQYRKVSGEVSRRTLHPYGLVVKQGEWYLAAFCEEARELRSFKCSRIHTAQTLDEEFRIPAEFSLMEYWSKQEQEFKMSKSSAEYYPVVIRLKAEKKARLTHLEIIQQIEEEESLLLTLNLYSYEYACEHMLSILEYAELREPAELREALKKKLSNLMEIYTATPGVDKTRGR